MILFIILLISGSIVFALGVVAGWLQRDKDKRRDIEVLYRHCLDQAEGRSTEKAYAKIIKPELKIWRGL